MKEFYRTKKYPARFKFLAGFTLMEVIVSLVIITAVFGGLVATFVGVKRYVSRATRRVVTTNLNKQILNSLYNDVRADTWDAAGGALSSSVAGVTHPSTDAGVAGTVTIDNFDYGGATANSYVVRDVAGRDYRQVEVSVSYPTNQ